MCFLQMEGSELREGACEDIEAAGTEEQERAFEDAEAAGTEELERYSEDAGVRREGMQGRDDEEAARVEPPLPVPGENSGE